MVPGVHLLVVAQEGRDLALLVLTSPLEAPDLPERLLDLNIAPVDLHLDGIVLLPQLQDILAVDLQLYPA